MLIGGPNPALHPENFDPDMMLKKYNEHFYTTNGRGCDQFLQPSCDDILFQFLEEECNTSYAILDLETTELISDHDKRTFFREMTISVAGVLLLERYEVDECCESGVGELGRYYSLWNEEAKRGAPMRFLYHILDNALGIVAYNGKTFDLQVLAGSRLRVHDPSGEADGWYNKWQDKLFDPFHILQSQGFGMISLAKLLTLNGIDPKSGRGADAPGLWANQRWEVLENYCRRDVTALAELVLKESALVREHTNPTSIISLAHAQKCAPTQQLTQGSKKWFEARKGKITASLAPALLGYVYFTPPDQAIQIVLGNITIAENQHMARGIKLEPVAANAFVKIWNGRVEETGLWIHPQYPWLAASPDRLLDGVVNEKAESALLEIKAPTKARTPTDSHIIQMMLQMACTGRNTCYLLQYVESTSGGQPTMRVDKIAYHKSLFDVIVTEFDPFRVIISAVERGDRMDVTINGPSKADMIQTKKALEAPLKQVRTSMVRFF